MNKYKTITITAAVALPISIAIASPQLYQAVDSLAFVNGDLNGDGDLEVYTGDPRHAGGQGRVTVVIDDLGTLQVQPFTNDAWSFGRDIDIGDFNGDGIDDLVVGIPGWGTKQIPSSGSVRLYLGSTDITTPGPWDHIAFSQDVTDVPGIAEDSDYLGEAVALGDFNCDGFDDLAIGVPGEDLGPDTDAGAVMVHWGNSAASASSDPEMWTQSSPGVPGSPEDYDRFGSDLSAGDLDGDGCDELLVGMGGEYTSAGLGAAYILQGSPSGLSDTGGPGWVGPDDFGLFGDTQMQFANQVTIRKFPGWEHPKVAVSVNDPDAGCSGDATSFMIFGTGRVDTTCIEGARK